MNYAKIKPLDVANGVGVRVSLFVSGCTHHCEGCFNSKAWDFNYGEEFTEEIEEKIIKYLEPNYIKGLTLLGGEPFEPQNQEMLLHLLKRVKMTYSDKDIWCYTGYLYDTELLCESRARCQFTDEMLMLIDVLVDGEFVDSLKDLNLRFKGSSNQRIINLEKTRKCGKIVLFEE